VLRYKNGKLMRMLSLLHRDHLRIVDHHEAWWPLEADETDGPAVLDELLQVFGVADPTSAGKV
jgi:hypothetical protein